MAESQTEQGVNEISKGEENLDSEFKKTSGVRKSATKKSSSKRKKSASKSKRKKSKTKRK